MKPLVLLPLGGADRRLLRDLVPALWDALHAPVEIGSLPADLRNFFDAGRGQYNSTRILTWMRAAAPDAVRRAPAETVFLAVLPHDLFIPILTFVFGEAELGGTVAVVSYHRLMNERYGLPPDAALLGERLLKEVLHEVGHTRGLIHCRTQECVMRSSSSVEEIDLKRAGFCSECGALLSAGGDPGTVASDPGVV